MNQLDGKHNKPAPLTPSQPANNTIGNSYQQAECAKCAVLMISVAGGTTRGEQPTIMQTIHTHKLGWWYWYGCTEASLHVSSRRAGAYHLSTCHCNMSIGNLTCNTPIVHVDSDCTRP